MGSGKAEVLAERFQRVGVGTGEEVRCGSVGQCAVSEEQKEGAWEGKRLQTMKVLVGHDEEF